MSTLDVVAEVLGAATSRVLKARQLGSQPRGGTLDIVAEVLREVAPRALTVREIAERAGTRITLQRPEQAIRRDLKTEFRISGDKSAFRRSGSVGRAYIELNPTGDPASFNKLNSFAHARHLSKELDNCLKLGALAATDDERFFNPYAISSCSLVRIVYIDSEDKHTQNGVYLTIDKAETYLSWLKAGNWGRAGEIVAVSRGSRYSPIEARSPCGTYAAYHFAFRERSLGRSNCGPCEACVQAKRDYDNSLKRKRAVKNGQLKRFYGISIEEKQSLFESQGSCCAVCGGSDPQQSLGWCIDHDHETGDVRGVVCPHCNHLLGNLKKIVGSDRHDNEHLNTLAGPRVIDYLRHGAARTKKLLAELRRSR